MIAAAYLRKSTDQTAVADEERSVTRQLDAARAFAKKQGWRLPDAHVFSDDGISGAEFERRPGLMALLAALTPRPPFEVLIVYDADRIGREQIQASYVLKQISQGGCGSTSARTAVGNSRSTAHSTRW